MTVAAGSIRLLARRPLTVLRPAALTHSPTALGINIGKTALLSQPCLRYTERWNSSSTKPSPAQQQERQSPSSQERETSFLERSDASSSPTPQPTSKTSSLPKTIPGPAWVWLEPLGAPFKAYGRAQTRRPYLVQFLSTIVIYFLGDLSAQSMTLEDENGEKPPRDIARTLRALTIGGLASIPGYRWFMWLGNSFNYPSKVLSLATKVAVNQVLFTPIFNTYFFAMQALLSGASAHETWERVKLAVPVSWYNSCKLWPAVTAFSFTFIAPEYRNIFAGVIAIGWQTYLSILNQRAARAEAIQHEEEHVPTKMAHGRTAA